ncbi:MAG: TIGR03663 family protein, partial [Anaerolineae bacterium]|nr:TIGR03663 family protein [Anaerolineae bacterium]
MSAILPSTNLRPEPRSATRGGLLGGITLNWETAAYIAILILAIFTRFYILGDRVMSHDESLHTQFSYNLYSTGVFQHTPLMHGPILFHVTAFFYSLFGDNDFSARIYPAILGVIMTAGFPLLFRRWLGKWGALLLALMLLISPIWMYYNRYIREDTPNIFYAFLMIYCFFMYLDGPRHLRRKARWLYICAAAMLFMMGSKETGFIYLAIFGSFLTLFWVARLYQHIRKVPVRSLFNFLTMSVLVGGTVAVLMYVILNIALQPYPTLDDRLAQLTSQVSLLFQGSPISVDSAAFINWTLLLAVAVIATIVATMLWAFRGGLVRARWSEVVILLLLASVVCLGFIYIEELSFQPARATASVPEAPGDSAPIEQVATIQDLPIIAAWVVAGIVIIGVLYSYQAGWWRTLYRFRELDMLILMGTLLLPWLTPIIIVMAGANPKDYSPIGIQRAILSGLPLLAVSIVVGCVWNWRRWLIIAACFWVPFVFFFTTMFTNPNGIWSGVIGSLGYWLGEQATRRGSQPNYYYQIVILPMYEFLPLIGSVLAMLAGMVGFWRFRRQEVETIDMMEDQRRRAELESAETDPLVLQSLPFAPTDAVVLRANQKQLWLKRVPFVAFSAWLGVLNLIAYTLAGEKMPWLGTHLTIPMMFLTAWYFGTVFTHTDWSRFGKRGWLYLLLLPVLAIAGYQVLQPFIAGRDIFGLMQTQLSETGAWLAAIAVVVVIVIAIWRVRRITSGLHLRHMIGVAAFVFLALITFRAAWTASFINYDRANEFLVYAHGAPGWRLMMDQIEDISRRTTNGMDIRFAWGGNAWPASWYFRNLRFATYFGQDPSPGTLNDAVAVYASADIRGRVEPLLEDRYVRFDYTRMWWPMQDYFNLNAQRVENAIDFSGGNPISAQLRQGLLNIW